MRENMEDQLKEVSNYFSNCFYEYQLNFSCDLLTVCKLQNFFFVAYEHTVHQILIITIVWHSFQSFSSDCIYLYNSFFVS